MKIKILEMPEKVSTSGWSSFETGMSKGQGILAVLLSILIMPREGEGIILPRGEGATRIVFIGAVREGERMALTTIGVAHGLLGSPKDLSFLKEILEKDANDVVVHLCQANYRKTTSGVAHGGRRMAEEVGKIRGMACVGEYHNGNGR